MLFAGHGACGFGGDREVRAAGFHRLTQVVMPAKAGIQ